MSTVSGASAAAASAETSDAASSRADEISAYLREVRAALADLDPGVRDGLLDDLPAHLTEVAGADTAPLRHSLGSPGTFAAELRAAAGLAPAAGGDGPRTGHAGVSSGELTREYVGRLANGLARACGYDTTAEFREAFRPVWWFVRGAGIGLFLVIIGGWVSAAWYNPAGRVVLVLLFAVSEVVSIRLGRVWQRTDVGRQTAVIVNVICVVPMFYAALAVLTNR
ncbi:MAG TPA: hypothetical protein VKB59_19205 [Micromonosporaceae bacterium]|nr:hypothetical protein [Micromonosporaceae bacterium]